MHESDVEVKVSEETDCGESIILQVVTRAWTIRKCVAFSPGGFSPPPSRSAAALANALQNSERDRWQMLLTIGETRSPH